VSRERLHRVLIALGGNAIAGPSSHDPASQQAAIARAMEQVAEVIAEGYEVALTHGNGPQVGDRLLINELAGDAVAPAPLDWCVAETQATLGYLIANALEHALRTRGIERLAVPVITRVLVDPDDPAWKSPTKPVGEFTSKEDVVERIRAGEAWGPQGERGWRRLVPSPEPRQIVDEAVIQRLVDDGTVVVVAGGGGGIPMVTANGGRCGAEAVLDKDLTGALLAAAIGAECFLIATDVPAAAVNFGSRSQEWVGHVAPEELRLLVGEGHFASGSMAPKVEAALRFVENGGGRAVITSLDRLSDALLGGAGTVVESHPLPAA
jgi:carbamate kinase